MSSLHFQRDERDFRFSRAGATVVTLDSGAESSLVRPPDPLVVAGQDDHVAGVSPEAIGDGLFAKEPPIDQVLKGHDFGDAFEPFGQEIDARRHGFGVHMQEEISEPTGRGDDASGAITAEEVLWTPACQQGAGRFVDGAHPEQGVNHLVDLRNVELPLEESALARRLSGVDTSDMARGGRGEK